MKVVKQQIKILERKDGGEEEGLDNTESYNVGKDGEEEEDLYKGS